MTTAISTDIVIHVYSKPQKPSKVLVITRDAQILQNRTLGRAGKGYALEYVSGLVDGLMANSLTVEVKHHPMIVTRTSP